jgi:hypothetical protein
MLIGSALQSSPATTALRPAGPALPISPRSSDRRPVRSASASPCTAAASSPGPTSHPKLHAAHGVHSPSWQSARAHRLRPRTRRRSRWPRRSPSGADNSRRFFSAAHPHRPRPRVTRPDNFRKNLRRALNRYPKFHTIKIIGNSFGWPRRIDEVLKPEIRISKSETNPKTPNHKILNAAKHGARP